MTRPPYPELWMRTARLMAERGTCARLHVGAVIVSPDNVLLTTSWNGSLPGQPHCEDAGCVLDESGRCRRTIHAERNALNHAARYGIAIAGSTLYVTHEPCSDCLISAISAGISRIIYGLPYAQPDALREYARLAVSTSGVTLEPLKGITS